MLDLFIYTRNYRKNYQSTKCCGTGNPLNHKVKKQNKDLNQIEIIHASVIPEYMCMLFYESQYSLLPRKKK